MAVRVALVGVGGAGINMALGLCKNHFDCERVLLIGRDRRMLKLPKAQRLILDIPKPSPVEIKRAVRKHKTRIRAMLKGQDMMLLLTGLGGATGGFTAPVLASEGAALGLKILAVVCEPFDFESYDRQTYFHGQLAELRKRATAVIQIPNQMLTFCSPPKTSMEQGFDNLNAALASFLLQIFGGTTEH